MMMMMMNKIIPKWFYILYCDKCEKYREFTNISEFHNRLQRILVTCNYCQNDLKTFNDRKVRCSSCFRIIEPKFETHF